MQKEGHSDVLSYRFFVNSNDRSARAVIDYAGPEAWLGHHDIAMGWPEMQRLHAVATLRDVTFLGPLTPEIKAWLQGAKLVARIHGGNEFVAGFQR